MKSYKLLLLIFLLPFGTQIYAGMEDENVYQWQKMGKNNHERISDPVYVNGRRCIESWTGKNDDHWDRRLSTASIIDLAPNTSYVLQYDVAVDAAVDQDSFIVVPNVYGNNVEMGWQGKIIPEGPAQQHLATFKTNTNANNPASMHFWFGSQALDYNLPHTLCIDNVEIKSCPILFEEASFTASKVPNEFGVHKVSIDGIHLNNATYIWEVEQNTHTKDADNNFIIVSGSASPHQLDICVSFENMCDSPQAKKCTTATVHQYYVTFE